MHKAIIPIFIFFIFSTSIYSQVNLPGFYPSQYFNEQIVSFYFDPEIKIHINAPAPHKFNENLPVQLILYALPNGNTTEQTIGKIIDPGDDWHFDIQHIGAQVRFLRENFYDNNFVIVYLESEQRSWPAWKSAHEDYKEIIKNVLEYTLSLFTNYKTEVVLTGHSGGGRFIFSFIDAFLEIPSYVKRISFLDGNYGYENEYGDKIIHWLNASPNNFLNVIAYNDSIALYNGKTFVSPAGGTWYRSRAMKNYFEKYLTFMDEEDNEFIRHTALEGRVKFILKKNPRKEILHTVQVERNGFIHGMLSGTSYEERNYKYFGARIYSKWMQINKDHIPHLRIPPRSPFARIGSRFMQDIINLSFAEREEEIFKEISLGNIPQFLRKLISIEELLADADGKQHSIKYHAMPDYLAVGSDSDFCRIPMGPLTAQKIADLFGAILPTKKLVDGIYSNSKVKLEPQFYAPAGNQNELVTQFIKHNDDIEKQRLSSGGNLGDLTAGIKKDIVLSNKISDTSRTHHVVIYGWHKPDGRPIQPVTNIHINSYVDYSHGTRLLNNYFLLDKEIKRIDEMLTDPMLYKILSAEENEMTQSSYISEPGKDYPSFPRKSFFIIRNYFIHQVISFFFNYHSRRIGFKPI